MKISNEQLKQVIREELNKVLNENITENGTYPIINWQLIEEHEDTDTPFEINDEVVEMFAGDDDTWIRNILGDERADKIRKMFEGETVAEFFGNPANGPAVNQFFSLVETLTDVEIKYPVGMLILGGDTHIRGYKFTFVPGIGFSFVGESENLISAVEAEGTDGKVYFEPGYTSTDSLFGNMEYVLQRYGVLELEKAIRMHGRRSRYSGTSVDAVNLDFNKLIELLNNGTLAAKWSHRYYGYIITTPYE
jgi:hypothetical protein